MAIAFVAASAAATGSNPLITIPAGFAEGNLLVLVSTGTATSPTPTGWTLRYAQGAGRFITIFTRYAGSQDTTVTLSGLGTSGKSAVLCYSGAGSYDVVGTVATGSSTSAATTSQTTTYNNDFVISIFARASGANSTFTVPASTTSRVNSGSNPLINGLLLVDELQATAGATAVRTSTLSASGNWAAINISFVPTRTLYWVGGTGTWNTTTTGNWANTSGGTPGTIKPPVQNEIVNIDTSSGTGTITCTGGVCGDLSVTASQAIVLGAAASTLSVFGNLTFPSGGSFSASTNAWTITMAATSAKTITTNGKSFVGLTFDGVTGNWTLPSAITASGVVALTNGTITLSTNTTTFTCLTFNSANSNTRAIAFGTGQIILTGNNATVWNNATSTNFTTTGTFKIVSTPTTYSGTRTFALSTSSALHTIGPGSGNQISFGNTGGDSVAISGVVTALDFTGYLGTWAQGTNTLSITTGNLTLSAGMTCTASTGVISFTATSGTQIVTSAGKSINSVTKVGVGGTLRLADNLTIPSGPFTLTSGALDLGTNNRTLSCQSFASANSNTRSIAFGTSGNITTTLSGGGTVWSTATTTGLTNSGTPTVNISCNSSSTIEVSAPLATVTGGNFNFNFTTGTYTLTIPTSTFLGSLNFTGFAGTWAPGANTYSISGSVFTLSSGMTFTTNTGLFTFNRGATVTINLGGKTIGPTSFSGGTNITLAGNFTSNSTMFIDSNCAINLAGFTTSGITAITTSSASGSPGISISNGVLNCASYNQSFNADLTINANSAIVTTGNFTYNGATTSILSIAATGAYITCGGLFTLTRGTLNLGNNTLTTSTFASSNGNTRSITFGSGSITTTSTGGGTVFNMANSNAFTYTNPPIINISGGGTVNLGSSNAFTESNALSFNISGGTAFNVITPSQVKSLVFTGFTSNWSPGIDALTFYGNLTLESGMVFNTGSTAWNFSATSGTQIITSAGKSLFSITQNGVGGTVSLGDALTLTSTYTLTNGTFNANNQNVTVGTFSSNNSNTRTITMGSGTWTLTIAGTIWNLATTTGLTFNKDTANIVTSSVSTNARTFAGGGLTYNNLTIGGATGTSTFTFTGANTFATLASTKTVAHTIVFPNVTTTVSDWTITGTAGNVVTLTRTGASGTFTLAKTGGGIISGINYLSISNSTASPADTWYAGANSTNGGGNTGWIFANFGVTTGNYFLLF